MSAPASLARVALRDHIHRILRDEIVRGELPPGSVVRDTEVAARLGASRTPVREALVRLTSEGLLQNPVGRGFRVPPLVRREVEEIHPLLERFEPIALELSAPCSKSQARKLAGLLRRLAECPADAHGRHELDAAWHRCLISGCDNTRLLRTIEELRDALRRYEIAYLHGSEGMELSVTEHAAIAEAFENEERERAAELLCLHWHRGRDELLAILSKEPQPS